MAEGVADDQVLDRLGDDGQVGRRGGEVPNEPLMLVETQPGAEGARSDNQS